MSSLRRVTRKYAADRKSDRHKSTKDRHKNRSDDSGHRCICGYTRCKDVRNGFRGTRHIFDTRPILLKIPRQCEEWTVFFDSLMRNLHVTPEIQQKLNGMKLGDRFAVCAHHFTEETVLRYWRNDSVGKCWAKQFKREEACLFLHLPLDNRDRDKNNNYFIDASHPMEDAASIAVSLHSNRAERASHRSSDDATSESMRSNVTVEDNNGQQDREETIRSLRVLVKKLQEKNRQLRQAKKRKMDRINSVVSDNKQLRGEMDQCFTLDDVTDILRCIGGLSRATIFDKAFHDKHPTAAKCMWGFESYDETLAIVDCLFPDVNVEHVPILNPNINHVRTPWKLSNEDVQEYKRSAGMIKEDRETSDTRVVVEDGYDRYRNETVLKGTVSYWEIALLPYANEWVHAVINLSRPIRFPGDKSCFINSDIYWRNNT